MASYIQSIYAHRVLLSLGGIYLLAVAAVALILGARPHEFLVMLDYVIGTVLFAAVFVGALFALFLLRALVAALKGRGKISTLPRRVAEGFDARVSAYMDLGLLPLGLAGLVSLMLMNGFILAKSLIPYLNPYSWDPLFAAMDKAMHGGFYPHELLTPWIDGWGWSGFIDMFYLLWFPIMFSVCAWCLFCERDFQARMQFLWAYTLTWIFCGTILSVIFSSAGPIFFGAIYPDLDNPYEGLVAHLAGVTGEGERLAVFQAAEMLLAMYRHDAVVDLNAISAMPSLHVAVAWLIVLYAWPRGHWRVRAAAAIFFALIMVGSVYLAWHYAVDGYFAVLAASILWWLSGWIVRRLHPAP